MGVAGIIVYEHAREGEDIDQTRPAFAGIGLMAAGSAMVIASVPIFIRSGYYKRKVLDMSAGLKFEPYQSGLAIKNYPAIGLSISL